MTHDNPVVLAAHAIVYWASLRRKPCRSWVGTHTQLLLRLYIPFVGLGVYRPDLYTEHTYRYAPL